MYYYTGETLDERMKKTGELNPVLALTIYQDMLHVLHYLKGKHVVHNDIKGKCTIDFA